MSGMFCIIAYVTRVVGDTLKMVKVSSAVSACVMHIVVSIRLCLTNLMRVKIGALTYDTMAPTFYHDTIPREWMS